MIHPMDPYLRLTLSIAVLIYFICLFYFLKKKSLNLKYTLLWLFSGVIMVLVLIFPNQLEWILHKIGVKELTSGIFAIVLFALIIILISITSIVSSFNGKLRSLVQQCAMYEKRIRYLEEMEANRTNGKTMTEEVGENK